jgi:hypothetical protein
MTANLPVVPESIAGDPAKIAPPADARARAIRRTLTARAILAGNSRALRHGVYSEVAVREDVLDEAALLYARAPHLDPIRHGHLVEATARLVVRLRKLDDALELDPASVSLSSMACRLEGQLQRNLSELGLTPRAARDLGLPEREAGKMASRLTAQTLARYSTGSQGGAEPGRRDVPRGNDPEARS